MAANGGKKEKLIILEEIYQNDKTGKKPKVSFKEYFKDPKRAEKALSGAIVFFGLAAVALGFFQIKSNIYGSLFTGDGANTNVSDNDPSDLLGLRQKDTDQDGLSDYDELNLYNTSPYLPDSDSDGVIDQKEIIMGTDPNCHPNQNCFASWDGTSPPESETSDGLQPSMDDLLLTGTIQASQLRNALKDAGMSAEQISNFSDDELIQMYQEIVAENGTAQITVGEQTAAVDANTTVADLTPTEIRALLLDSGISSDILDGVSDADLMQLVNETLVNN